MNRKIIFLLILLDLALLAGAGFMGWNRYLVLQGEKIASEKSVEVVAPVAPVVQAAPPPEAVPPVAPSETPVVTDVVVATAPVAPPTPPPAKTGGELKTRRTFVYYSPKATSVKLVGDFNQWEPQNFRKKGSGRWEVSVLLAPGDYSYNFVVDGKVIRDRNQRRTDAKGRSLLTVAP